MKRLLTFLLLLCLKITAMQPNEQCYTPPITLWNNACHKIAKQDWGSAAVELQWLTKETDASYMDGKPLFWLGISYFHLGQLLRANKTFDQYLSSMQVPEYFEQTIYYKLLIANRWTEHATSGHFLQRFQAYWRGDYEEAVDLYDQIASILPNEEVAAFAIYHKACLQLETEHYREAIESFRALLRNYDYPDLEVAAYFGIARVYYRQSLEESSNPDLLPLARVNMRSFAKAFPEDERVVQLERLCRCMEESYAHHLLDIASFYEHQEHCHAARMYWELIIQNYPNTHAARLSRQKLA